MRQHRELKKTTLAVGEFNRLKMEMFLHNSLRGLIIEHRRSCHKKVIGTGTRVPVSISVTRVPVRYPGTRVALNARLDVFVKSAKVRCS